MVEYTSSSKRKTNLIAYFMKKNSPLLPCLIVLVAAPLAMLAQPDIVHSGGQADLTFFYDVDAASGSQWGLAFREKSGTVATGLTDQANQTRPGANSGDYNFGSLTYQLNNPSSLSFGGDSFFLTAYASAGAAFPEANDNTGTPDIGIRTRLAEGGLPVEERFTSFSLRLSSFSGPGEILFLSGTGGNIIYDSRDGAFDSSTVWYGNPQGHDHFYFGFSEIGDYTLDFEFDGVYGPDDIASELGTQSIAFSVVPEPAHFAALFGLAAFGLISCSRMTRRKKAAA